MPGCGAHGDLIPQNRTKIGLNVALSRFVTHWQAFFLGIIRQRNSLLLKTFFMSGLLYLIAVILIIGWLLGVFVYSVGGLIHVLIVLALISLILGIIRRA
jgi:hypothetical protein